MEFESAIVAKNQQICHLCTRPFDVEQNQKSTGRSIEDGIVRAKKLVNFCTHMNISSDGLPENCPEEFYPMCNDCLSKIEFFWGFQKESDRIKFEHGEVISKGWRDESSSTSGSSVFTSLENREVLQLRFPIVIEHSIRRRAINAKRLAEYKQKQELAMGQRETPSVAVSATSLDVNGTDTSTTIGEAEEGTHELPSSSSSVAGNITIGGEDRQAADSRGSEIESDGAGAANSPEDRNRNEDDSMDDDSVFSDSSDEDIFTKIDKETRKHNGIVYFRCIQYRPDDQYFECDTCGLTIPFPQIGVQEKGALKKMTDHIESKHLDRPYLRALRPRKDLK